MNPRISCRLFVQPSDFSISLLLLFVHKLLVRNRGLSSTGLLSEHVAMKNRRPARGPERVQQS